MSFSDRSVARTEGVDPRLVQILQRAAQISGVPFQVSEGMRSIERQKKMVAAGKSQTMNSRHLHGNAVDIYIPDGKGGVNWGFEAYRPIADAAKQAAAELGYDDFVWGGDWKTLKDGVHFQIGGNHAKESGGASSGAPQAPIEGYTPGNYVSTAQAAPQPQQNALSTPEPQLGNALTTFDNVMPQNQLAAGGFDVATNPFLSYLRGA